MERTDDGPSLTRDLALATWGLFVGLAFLLLAAGLFGTLLGVRSELVGLPTVVSSLISASITQASSSAHVWRCPRWVVSATSASTPRSRRCCPRRCWRSASPTRRRHG